MLERAERKNHAPRIAELTAKLATPPFPTALDFIWKAFWRLRRRKAGGMSGPSPIDWPDIEAFVRRSRLNLAPWEVEILERLDDCFLASHAEQAERDNNPNSTPAGDDDGVKDVLSRGAERRIIRRTGGES